MTHTDLIVTFFGIEQHKLEFLKFLEPSFVFCGLQVVFLLAVLLLSFEASRISRAALPEVESGSIG